MRRSFLTVFVLALGSFCGAAWTGLTSYAATAFTVVAGAEGQDMAVQIYDFIPQPVTINVGDTVNWRVDSTEFHTVTFLSGAPPPPFVGPTEDGPAFDPLAAFPTGPGDYDGSGLRSSGLLEKDNTYSLTFTAPGSFEYVCLVHHNMRAQVIVREAGAPADTPAATEAAIGPHIADDLATRGLPLMSQYAVEGVARTAAGDVVSQVTAGAGDQHVAIYRFLPGNVNIRTSELVEWVNRDPDTPHTVTFLAGQDAPEVVTPLPQAEGPPRLLMNPQVLEPHGGESFNGTGFTSSGFIGGPESPDRTSYALRFVQPGTYEYLCVLHEQMGMKGTVTVLP